MKITIITATCNSAPHIANCIESVNNQTYPNIEHIIVDGASTDNTLEIIKSNKSRVVKLISEPDHGIYDALNKGIRLATGDVIGFLHADDTFASPTTIKALAKEFLSPHLGGDVRRTEGALSFESEKTVENKNVIHGIYGNLVFTNAQNKVVRTWQSKPFHPKNVRHGCTCPPTGGCRHTPPCSSAKKYMKNTVFSTLHSALPATTILCFA